MISNELSGDIAVAILGGKKLTTNEKMHLKETVLKIHSTLQELSEESRKRRVRNLPVPGPREGVLEASGG